MINLYLLDVSLVPSSIYLELFHNSPESVQQKATRFRQELDQQRCIIGDYMTRVLLSEKSGISRDEIKFTKNQYGKKYLLEQSSPFFNLSHSGNWILLGIGREEIGVDLEQFQVMDYLGISSYFNEKEQCYLNGLQDENVQMEFFRFWTAKESYLKFIGKGLSQLMNTFQVPIDSASGFIIDLEDEKLATSLSFPIKNEYYVSVCSKKIHNLSYCELTVKWLEDTVLKGR